MKNLLIIGARGWGREVYNMLPHCIGYETEFAVKGFLDDKSDALDGMPGYPQIISCVEDYQPQPDDVFVCALGDTHWKRHYIEMVLAKGGKFINIIHQTADIDRNTTLGYGCIVCKYVGISCDTRIGDFVTIQGMSIIGHDTTIGNYCHLGGRAFIGGGAQLGESTIIQTNAIILPHVKVGNNSVVGAGSVVIRKIKSGTTVFGNPAREFKY
ncbi:MAG: acetyltransferase [Prevotella sp.]|nr:acetyltransferase [Prevotella sp.]